MKLIFLGIISLLALNGCQNFSRLTTGSPQNGSTQKTSTMFGETFKSSSGHLVTELEKPPGPVRIDLDIEATGKSDFYIIQQVQNFSCKVEFFHKTSTGDVLIPTSKIPFNNSGNMNVCVAPKLIDLDGDQKPEITFSVPGSTGGEELEIYKWNGKELTYITPFEQNPKTKALKRIFRNITVSELDDNPVPELIDYEVGDVKVYSLSPKGFEVLGKFVYLQKLVKKEDSEYIIHPINLKHGGNYVLKLKNLSKRELLKMGELVVNNKSDYQIKTCKKINELKDRDLASVGKFSGGIESDRHACFGNNIFYTNVHLRRENEIKIKIRNHIGSKFLIMLEKI